MPLSNAKDSLSIEPMGLADIEAVHQIELCCHSHPWSKKLFLSNFGRRYFNHLVLENNQVVGYFVASSVAGEVTLMNIAISPTKQGLGYGKVLLQALLDYAKQHDEQEVWLEVRESNVQAISLYSKLGFAEVDRRKAYYPCDSGREDALIMCCYL